VLAAEHLLGLAGIDLCREVVERAAQILPDWLSGFSPLDQDGQVVDLALQRFAERPVVLEAPAALEELLCCGLVLPELRGRNAFFDFGEFVGGACGVKDSSAGPAREA
jgi:hypothetical protein